MARRTKIKSIEKSKLEGVFIALGEIFAEFKNSDMSLQEYRRREQKFYTKLTPYSRTSPNLVEFRSMLEQITEEIFFFDWNFLYGELDHENSHALAVLGWTQQQGIEVTLRYGVRIYHINLPGGKVQKPLLFLEYPDIEEKLNWDKKRYLGFVDYLFTHSESSPIDRVTHAL